MSQTTLMHTYLSIYLSIYIYYLSIYLPYLVPHRGRPLTLSGTLLSSPQPTPRRTKQEGRQVVPRERRTPYTTLENPYLGRKAYSTHYSKTNPSSLAGGQQGRHGVPRERRTPHTTPRGTLRPTLLLDTYSENSHFALTRKHAGQ